MPTRRYGWKRQPPDARDFRFTPPRRMLQHLAAAVDLSAGMGPQLNQGDLGACGPCSVAELIDYDQKAQGLPLTPPSRLFVYYVTRQTMGTVGQDSGVDNRSLLTALNHNGYCAETAWPYADNLLTVQPPANAYAEALPNAIQSYSAVAVYLATMQGTLASGYPFLFGFDAYAQLESEQAATTGVVLQTAGATPIGGHDVTIVGYDDAGFGKIAGGAFKFRNHWLNPDGSPWGDNGYGYISYGYATSPAASDFWVINAVPAPAKPTPPPVPVLTSSPLFSLTLAAAQPAGTVVQFPLPVALTAGKYDVVAAAAVLAAALEPWTNSLRLK
jgi:hypothetical protein